MTNFFNSEPMRYWSFPSSMDKTTRQEHLEQIAARGTMIYSLKTDGNWSRAIITPERAALQTRGVSKVTQEYGEIQDKVFFWDDICKAFSDTTVFLGEVYLDGGVDKNVGSILRSKEQKAKSIQDNDYYAETAKKTKFSAKDKRDIEGNEFRNQKLKMRIFDVLAYEGEEIIDRPTVERITYIDKIVKKIGNPLITGVEYHEVGESFFEELTEIFANGGEGVVCYKKSAPYAPGKRTAWDTIKVKQELADDIDCFIYDIEPAIEEYTGKDIGTWTYWKNMKTGEKLYGEYYSDYRLGKLTLAPITKGHYHGWAGAIYCAVFDENGKPYVICKCAGLTEEFKEELKNNYEKYHMMPLKITGMMVSDSNGLSIRHPKIVSLRENDIDIRDCSLEKVKAQL